MENEDSNFQEDKDYGEEAIRLSRDYDIDLDEAEKVQELIDTEGLDEEEAIELNDVM